jgi:predicted HAD superfamily Cof-like phosphohydrolase
MNKLMQDVMDFHKKFDVPIHPYPKVLDQAMFEYRYTFLKEELDEFADAHYEGDLQQCADALVDIVYVALGTAIIMGLPFDELWDPVQRANMAKRRAATATESKRGSSFDVIKPDGWVGPTDEQKLVLLKYIEAHFQLQSAEPCKPSTQP